MSAHTIAREAILQERPRAFAPPLAAGLPRPARPPGWDVGPERRIDDGRTLARMLGWAGLGLGALVVGALALGIARR